MNLLRFSYLTAFLRTLPLCQSIHHKATVFEDIYHKAYKNVCYGLKSYMLISLSCYILNDAVAHDIKIMHEHQKSCF